MRSVAAQLAWKSNEPKKRKRNNAKSSKIIVRRVSVCVCASCIPLWLCVSSSRGIVLFVRDERTVSGEWIKCIDGAVTMAASACRTIKTSMIVSPFFFFFFHFGNDFLISKGFKLNHLWFDALTRALFVSGIHFAKYTLAQSTAAHNASRSRFVVVVIGVVAAAKHFIYGLQMIYFSILSQTTRPLKIDRSIWFTTIRSNERLVRTSHTHSVCLTCIISAWQSHVPCSMCASRLTTASSRIVLSVRWTMANDTHTNTSHNYCYCLSWFIASDSAHATLEIVVCDIVDGFRHTSGPQWPRAFAANSINK